MMREGGRGRRASTLGNEEKGTIDATQHGGIHNQGEYYVLFTPTQSVCYCTVHM